MIHISLIKNIRQLESFQTKKPRTFDKFRGFRSFNVARRGITFLYEITRRNRFEPIYVRNRYESV